MQNIEKIISSLIDYFNLDEANICKRNEGFIASFHEYNYSSEEFENHVDDIRDIIDNLHGFLVVGGCRNTLHIVIFTKIMYLENEKTMYLEVSTGKIIEKRVSKEQALRIANKIGLDMHIL